MKRFFSMVSILIYANSEVALGEGPAFSGQGTEQGQSSEKFNAHTATTEYFMSGKRKFSIIATAEGYYPEKMSAFVGEELTFFFTNTQKTPHCLTIPEKNIFLSGVRGSITEAATTFNQPGKYIFYCPSLSHRGELTILPRTEAGEKASAQRRSLASLPEEESLASDGPWIPRDE